MKTIFSPAQQLHHGAREFTDGQWTLCNEHPGRSSIILAELEARKLGDIVQPQDWGIDPILRVHSPAFVEFLQNAWTQWQAEGRTGDMLPSVWCSRGMRTNRVPESLDGKLGYYSFDSGTPIMSGTWQAVYAATQVAITGAHQLSLGEQGAFSLCRPPGHHAAVDQYGGYCFFNNAAIATQFLLDSGCNRVAILDIDYHHGNGTQSIFYQRNDVYVVSLHAHPSEEYPFFLGYEDERGDGIGEGYNLNLPMRLGTDWALYGATLDHALQVLERHGTEILVVSLGCDTFHDDPISRFRLTSENYIRLGEKIAAFQKPTLFVLEGGYAVDALGINVANVLTGFLGKR